MPFDQHLNRKSPIKTLARSDALYSVVGGVTLLLELALFATNIHFGKYALEALLIFQLIASTILETASSAFTIRFGAVKMITIGVIAKLFASIFLAIAAIISFYGYFFVTWFFIILFLVADNIGIGTLTTGYRPAYTTYYKRETKGEAPDYLLLFKNTLLLRIGAPCLILSLVVVTQYLFTIPLQAVGWIIFFMLFVKVWHLVNVFLDFHGKGRSQNFVKVEKDSFSLRRAIGYVKKHSFTVLLFIYANFIHLMVFMYGVGLVYREFSFWGASMALSWMGGSQVGFVVLIFSTLASRFFFPKLSGKEKSPLMRSTLIGGLGLLSLFFIIGSNLSPTFSIIALILFCLLSPPLTGGLRTMAINLILAEGDAHEHTSILLVIQFITNMVMLGVTASGLLFSKTEEYNPIVNMSLFALIVALILLARILFKSRLPASEAVAID